MKPRRSTAIRQLRSRWTAASGTAGPYHPKRYLLRAAVRTYASISQYSTSPECVHGQEQTGTVNKRTNSGTEGGFYSSVELQTELNPGLDLVDGVTAVVAGAVADRSKSSSCRAKARTSIRDRSSHPNRRKHGDGDAMLKTDPSTQASILGVGPGARRWLGSGIGVIRFNGTVDHRFETRTLRSTTARYCNGVPPFMAIICLTSRSTSVNASSSSHLLLRIRSAWARAAGSRSIRALACWPVNPLC